MANIQFSWPRMAKNENRHLVLARKNVSNVADSFLANIQVIDNKICQIHENSSKIGKLSWSEQLLNADFSMIFGQILAKMVFLSWPMFQNCQKSYLSTSTHQKLGQRLVLAKIWPKNVKFPVKQFILPTWLYYHFIYSADFFFQRF